MSDFKYKNKLVLGDSIELMNKLPSNFFHAVVTDPPYGIELMGLDWDSKFKNDSVIQSINLGLQDYDDVLEGYYKFSYAWAREAYRILKPGGYVLAFSSIKTQDILSLALRRLGYWKRDILMWAYSTG